MRQHRDHLQLYGLRCDVGLRRLQRVSCLRPSGPSRTRTLSRSNNSRRRSLPLKAGNGQTCMAPAVSPDLASRFRQGGRWLDLAGPVYMTDIWARRWHLRCSLRVGLNKFRRAQPVEGPDGPVTSAPVVAGVFDADTAVQCVRRVARVAERPPFAVRAAAIAGRRFKGFRTRLRRSPVVRGETRKDSRRSWAYARLRPLEDDAEANVGDAAFDGVVGPGSIRRSIRRRPRPYHRRRSAEWMCPVVCGDVRRPASVAVRESPRRAPGRRLRRRPRSVCPLRP